MATCSCDTNVVLTDDHYSNTVTIVTDTCNFYSKYNCSRALIDDYIYNMMYIINVITYTKQSYLALEEKIVSEIKRLCCVCFM